MTFPLYAALDMQKNELQNSVLQNLTSNPSSPVKGQQFFNSSVNYPYEYNGTAFVTAYDRAQHFGTQLASTISNFAAAANALTLDTFAAPVAAVAMNAQRLTGLANGTAAQDAVTFSQLSAAIQGIDQKPTADAGTLANVVGTYVNGASLGVGATFTVTATGVFVADGYTVLLNDRVFFNFQTAQLQNGLYLCTTQGAIGVSAVFTRDTELDLSAKFKGALILVGETSTTLKGGQYLSNQQAPVVGTDAITFTQINSLVSYSADETSIHQTGNQFGIKSTWAGQAAITTVGTITTGTWQGTTVAAGFGGTGATAAFVAGAVVYGASTSALASSAAGTTGQVLLSGGAGTPTWGTPSIANGGTGQTTAAAAFNALSPVTTLGDIIYGSAANVNSRLPGNTTSTKKFLTQTGTGTVSAAPGWNTIAVADVSGAVAKYGADIGDGSTTAIVVNHALNTTDVTVMVYDKTTKQVGMPTIQITDANNVTLTFSVAPTSAQLRVVVTG